MNHLSKKLSRRTLVQRPAIASTGLALGVALPGCINPVGSATPIPSTTATPTVTIAQSDLPTVAPSATSPAENREIEGPKTEAIEPTTNQDNATMTETNQMNIQIGERTLTATLVDNTSVVALKAALAAGPITINMRDYASMEKVGPLGMDLPRNDHHTFYARGIIPRQRSFAGVGTQRTAVE